MTHYELLGISGGATLDEIRQAYQNKIKDGSTANKNELLQAFKVLSDPVSREIYDDSLSMQEKLNEEIEYEKFVDEQEEYRLNDGDLLSDWTKLYRLSWKDYNSLSTSAKYQKIFAEILFRSFYGICGVIIVFVFMWYAGGVQFLDMLFSSSGFYFIKMIFIGIFAAFFVAAKYYAFLFKGWKLEKRSD